jgi:hypothetical protein
MTREEIRAVRRDVPADLEHELIPVAERDHCGVASHGSPVAKRLHRAPEREQATRPERLPPEAEERAERRGPPEVHDARRVVRPAADSRRDEDDPAVGEQLDVHALRRDRMRTVLVHRRRVVLRPRSDRRRYRHLAAIVAVLALAGCGGTSSAPTVSIPAARTYALEAARDGHDLTLKIVQPSGAPLTRFKRGSGPHTGVHVILVRRDLGVLLHRHPPVGADGRFAVDVASLPPGPYRVVVDVYPASSATQPNFQLFSTLRVPGAYAPQALPRLRARETVDGYTFTLHGAPKLRAVEPGFLVFTVRGPGGRAAEFTPWYGALAHAIFFRRGSLDYFHTHVCGAGATGCTSTFGGAKVTGTSSARGRLDVGVLVPVPGTWRLFLQTKADGHVVTAPFTLTVR